MKLPYQIWCNSSFLYKQCQLSFLFESILTWTKLAKTTSQPTVCHFQHNPFQKQWRWFCYTLGRTKKVFSFTPVTPLQLWRQQVICSICSLQLVWCCALLSHKYTSDPLVKFCATSTRLLQNNQRILWTYVHIKLFWLIILQFLLQWKSTAVLETDQLKQFTKLHEKLQIN